MYVYPYNNGVTRFEGGNGISGFLSTVTATRYELSGSSGGAGTLDHLAAVLKDGGASAVLAASIFHFGTYTVRQAKEHLRAAGLPVRL